MAKSFSIKVGADTKEFNQSLRAADNQIRTTTRLGDALTKTLEHKYDAKTAEQAQKQFQKALSDTQDKAESLRKQLIHMEKAGEIDSNQYRKLETDLAKATIEASNLEKKIESLSKIKVDQLSKGFTDLGGKIEGAGKKLAPFSAAAAGAIAGAAKLAKDAVSVGDDIMTMSDQFDMSIKSIQRWQYVAMQTDVESATLLKSMQKTQAAFGEQATGGTTAAVKALEELGLSYRNFDSNEEMFQAVIDSLSGIDDKTIQVAYATDILGERFASALVPMLQSKDAIAGYIDEFEQVGYLSDEVVQQLADLDNEVNKVTAQFAMAKTQLGVAMIPIYERLIAILENYVIPAIEKLAAWFDSLSPSMQNTILGVLALIAVAAPLLILIGKMTTGIGALIKVVPLLGAKLTALSANPIVAILGVLAALFTILYAKNEQFRESINQIVQTIGSALAPVLDIVTGLLNTVFEVLSPILDVLGMIISAALIPLSMQLKLLAIPLQVLGALIKPLMSMFEALGDVVGGVFGKVTSVIQSALNWVIDKINAAIRAVNKLGGVFGFEIKEMPRADLSTPEKSEAATGTTPYTNDELNRVYDDIGYNDPTTYGGTSTSNSYTENTSNDTFNIYIEANEYVSAEEVANIVSKKIATLAKARG